MFEAFFKCLSSQLNTTPNQIFTGSVNLIWWIQVLFSEPKRTRVIGRIPTLVNYRQHDFVLIIGRQEGDVGRKHVVLFIVLKQNPFAINHTCVGFYARKIIGDLILNYRSAIAIHICRYVVFHHSWRRGIKYDGIISESGYIGAEEFSVPLSAASL